MAVVSAVALQLPVTMEVASNLEALRRAIAGVAPGSLVVAPEGLLSGYLPHRGFVAQLDGVRTAWAMDQAAALAKSHGVVLVAGACLQDADGAWRNAALIFEPDGSRRRYDKVNLATSERGDFTPGDALPVFDVALGGAAVRTGVQMCREIRYAEQWRALAVQGAEVIAYVNNAIGSLNGHAVWRAHAVSRASELQRFVVGANNAAPDQTCPSLIVSPSGEVLAEATIGETGSIHAELDLALVSNWTLDQARVDLGL